MTASTFSRVPLMAGSVLASTLSQAGQWVWARYMRAPLASTGMVFLVTLTAMAASNALYFQTVRHPSPFFSPAPDVPQPVSQAEAATANVIAPVPQATTTLQTTSPETTSSVAPAPQAIPDAPVGNTEAFAVQKKLAELGLFSGTVDGFYGPMTAASIRAFETRNGMRPTGALSRSVVDAILSSDGAGRIAQPQAVIQPVTPAPAPVQAAEVQPAQTPVVQQQDRVIAQLPALSPIDHGVDTVGSAAAQTLDTLLAGVDGSRSRGNVAQPTVVPVPSQPLPAPIAAAPVVTAATAVAPTTAAVPAPVDPANNTQLVGQIQRGLASLGFYHGSIDGHPGDATARAIREFENFHSYSVTGKVNPDLVGLLQQAGATI